MKPRQWRRSSAGPYLRLLPRIKQFRGTWLHRKLGDRLFRSRCGSLSVPALPRDVRLASFCDDAFAFPDVSRSPDRVSDSREYPGGHHLHLDQQPVDDAVLAPGAVQAWKCVDGRTRPKRRPLTCSPFFPEPRCPSGWRLRLRSHFFSDGLSSSLKGWDWFSGRFLKARSEVSGKKTSRNTQEFCLVQQKGA